MRFHRSSLPAATSTAADGIPRNQLSKIFELDFSCISSNNRAELCVVRAELSLPHAAQGFSPRFLAVTSSGRKIGRKWSQAELSASGVRIYSLNAFGQKFQLARKSRGPVHDTEVSCRDLAWGSFTLVF